MKTIPLFINAESVNVLIVGGGTVALRKAKDWLDKDANVTIISREFQQDLRAACQGKARLVQRKATLADLDTAQVVYLATNDLRVNQQLAEYALQRGTLVNAVDQPQISNFISPAIVDRDPVQIAIGSSGTSPVLARQIKSKIELSLPANLGALAKLAAKFRHLVQKKFPDLTIRRKFWQDILNSDIPELVYRHQEDKAEKQLRRALISRVSEKQGRITLVGAGPGDPELLTLAAYKALQVADIIYYDALVSDEILKLARKDAEFVYVGKKASNHHKSQSQIEDLLIESAQQGLNVVRLKGGDPFIFGRGGEEVERARKHQIDIQVIPGITAASGCAAVTQIPLTHRELSQSVTFITGHKKDDQTPDWDALAQANTTLAIYMGHANLAKLADELLKRGRSGDTPIALIENGTLNNQREVFTDLANLKQISENFQRQGPVLTIIGEVVTLAEKFPIPLKSLTDLVHDEPSVTKLFPALSNNYL